MGNLILHKFLIGSKVLNLDTSTTMGESSTRLLDARPSPYDIEKPRFRCVFNDQYENGTSMPKNKKRMMNWISDFIEAQLQNESSRFYRRYAHKILHYAKSNANSISNSNSQSENNTNESSPESSTPEAAAGDGPPPVIEEIVEEQEVSTESSNQVLGGSLQLRDFDLTKNEPSNLTSVIPANGVPFILSEILSLDVMLIINDFEERVEGFIVKIPSEILELRNLGSLAKVYQREVDFYVEIFPELQHWAKIKETGNRLNVPRCFYGKYDRPADAVRIQDIHERVMDAESVLVLEDLRVFGYGKRSLIQGLSLDEIKASLREIAIFHAASWTMKENGEDLATKWSLNEDRIKEFAIFYGSLFEDNYVKLIKFLEKWKKKNDVATMIIEQFNYRKDHIKKTLMDLMKLPPSGSPLPYCLIHGDFWCDNLMFRRDDEDIAHAQEELNNSADDPTIYLKDPVDLDVKILDWQMHCIGIPTHDFAMLVVTSLSPENRRENWKNLLEFYFHMFRKAVENYGLTGLPFDETDLANELKKSLLLSAIQIICSLDLALADRETEYRLFGLLYDLYTDEIL